MCYHCYFLLIVYGGFTSIIYSQEEAFKFRQGSIKSEIIEGVKHTIFQKTSTKRVVFSSGKDLLFCDYAIRNEQTGNVQAHGNILIQQQKNGTIKSDSLFFFKEEKQAKIIGNVLVVQKGIELSTDILWYDFQTKNAKYLTGGKIEKKNFLLQSKKGYINSLNRCLSFKEDVVLDDLEKNQHLECDTLFYDIDTEIVIFPSTTFIQNSEGTLNAQKGSYNMQNGTFHFEKSTSIENERFILWAESIKRDQEEKTFVKKKVKFLDKKDSIILYGEEMQYIPDFSSSKVYGNPLMMKSLASDTLFLIADTLLSVEDTTERRKNALHAFWNVRIIMQKLQGFCDSLVYHSADSIIHFYGNPAFWNKKNQITADTVRAFLKGKQIERLYLKRNCFLIMEDTLGNYNQVKGREVVVFFKRSNITHLYVNGNAQSLYFGIKQDPDMEDKYYNVGMNKSDCGNMVLFFNKKNQLETFHCINQPDSKFIPTHELEEPDKRLPKFKLRVQDRPQKIWAYRRKK